MADWSASQYLKFEQERTQPSRDLANRITLHARRKIMDLGCGPGNSTRVLAERFPDSKILGIDNSADMIAQAQTNCPECEFQLLGVSPAVPLTGKYDLIFSNACIQWIPDHKKLIPNLFSALSEDGVLAIQVPETRNMPMYKILSAMYSHPKWAQKFAGIREFYTLELEEYYDLLARISPAFSIWESTYIHCIDGIDGLIEWYRGSGLRPYLAVLDEAEQMEFIQEVKTRLREFYPLRADGTLLMRFPRLFFTLARRHKTGEIR